MNMEDLSFEIFGRFFLPMCLTLHSLLYHFIRQFIRYIKHYVHKNVFSNMKFPSDPFFMKFMSVTNIN